MAAAAAADRRAGARRPRAAPPAGAEPGRRAARRRGDRHARVVPRHRSAPTRRSRSPARASPPPPATACRSTTRTSGTTSSGCSGRSPVASPRATSAATCRCARIPNVIDVLVELASGVTGSVHLDYVERDGGRAIRIVGDRGVLTVDLARRRRSRTRTPAGELRHEQHVERARRRVPAPARPLRSTWSRGARSAGDDRARRPAPSPWPRRWWRRARRGRGRTSRREPSTAHQIAVQPPSTGRFTPVTYCEASDARNATAPLMSSGPARRCSGTRRS